MRMTLGPISTKVVDIFLDRIEGILMVDHHLITVILMVVSKLFIVSLRESLRKVIPELGFLTVN